MAFRPTQRQFALPDGVKAYTQPLIMQEQNFYRPEKNPLNRFFYNVVLKHHSTYWAFVGLLAGGMSFSLDYVARQYVAKYNFGKTYEDVQKTFPEVPPNCDE